MKLQSTHTCPLWEYDDGTRRPGLNVKDPHPPVVGWCNVLFIRINDELRPFLAASPPSP